MERVPCYQGTGNKNDQAQHTDAAAEAILDRSFTSVQPHALSVLHLRTACLSVCYVLFLPPQKVQGSMFEVLSLIPTDLTHCSNDSEPRTQILEPGTVLGTSRQQLSQDIRKNTAVPVVVDFDRCINTQDERHLV